MNTLDKVKQLYDEMGTEIKKGAYSQVARLADDIVEHCTNPITVERKNRMAQLRTDVEAYANEFGVSLEVACEIKGAPKALFADK